MKKTSPLILSFVHKFLGSETLPEPELHQNFNPDPQPLNNNLIQQNRFEVTTQTRQM
jgi:hypothetical protein